MGYLFANSFSREFFGEGGRMEKPVRIFVSYSHLDRRWLDKADPHNIVPFLEASLSGRDVLFWYDLNLEPGVRFRTEIEGQIDTADIAILIVSQNFLNSDFIRKIELPRIEARAERKELLVLPILAEHCDWEDVESLRSRQMLPGAPLPLIEFLGREADWSRVRFEILQSLKKQVARLREGAVDEDGNALLGEIREKSLSLAVKLRPLPMSAFIFRKEVEPLARRLSTDSELEKSAGRSAAVLYRLFAGAILLDPAGQIKDSTREALPWLKRALATFPAFEDVAELRRAQVFFEGLLVPLRRDVEMKHVLKNEFRLVMIDAPETEVDAVTEKALAVVVDMIRQRDGHAPGAAQPPTESAAPPTGFAPAPAADPQGSISNEQRAAMKLGFVMGSKLTLAALPPQARTTPFSALPFALPDCRDYLTALGFGAADTTLVLEGTGIAMTDANPLGAAERLLGEINRVKDALGFAGRAGTMAAFRIGVSLGYVMEFAAILTKQGSQSGHVATFEALVQKHKSTLAGDILQSGLPAAVAEAVARARRTARVPEDLGTILTACQDIIAMLR
jgi:hypothetical protein